MSICESVYSTADSIFKAILIFFHLIEQGPRSVLVKTEFKYLLWFLRKCEKQEIRIKKLFGVLRYITNILIWYRGDPNHEWGSSRVAYKKLFFSIIHLLFYSAHYMFHIYVFTYFWSGKIFLLYTKGKNQYTSYGFCLFLQRMVRSCESEIAPRTLYLYLLAIFFKQFKYISVVFFASVID